MKFCSRSCSKHGLGFKIIMLLLKLALLNGALTLGFVCWGDRCNISFFIKKTKVVKIKENECKNKRIYD